MRFLKAMLGLLLSVALVFGSTAGALAHSPGTQYAASKSKKVKIKVDFKDWDDNYWAADAIARMLLRQIVIGDAGRIWPDRHVTRIEALLTIYRLYDWAMYRGTRNASFLTRDLDEQIPDWGYDAVIEGLHRKIVDKKGKKLGLNDKLTRLEATVLLVRAAGLETEAILRSGEDLRFRDENVIPRSYRGYVAVAVENGLIRGYPDGVFQPNKHVTRAEWFAMLTRLEDFFPPATSPGHLSQLRGTITAVQTGANASLTINTEKRLTGGTKYAMAPDYEVFIDGRRGRLTEVQAGDSVWVYLDEGRIIWASVTTEASKVSGRITAWRAPSGTRLGSVTVQTGSGSSAFDLKYDVATTATVQVGKYQTSFADVAVGQQVTLTVQRNVVTHMAITEAIGTVKGTLTAVSIGTGGRTVTIKDSANRQTEYVVSDKAKVYAVGGAEIDFGMLAIGDQVEVRLEHGIATRINVTKAVGTWVEGTVGAFKAPGKSTNGAITVKLGGSGGSKTFAVSPSATVVVNDKTGRFGDVLVGDKVRVLAHNNLVNRIELTLGSTVKGTVESTGLAGGSRVITIKESGKEAQSHVLDIKAVITSPYGDVIMFDDLRAGDQVEATVVRGLVTAVKVTVAKEISLSGAVKSIGMSNGRPTSLVLTRGTGSSAKDVTLSVSRNVTVTYKGNDFAFADLRKGDKVDVVVTDGAVTEVKVTERAAVDVSWTGTVADHNTSARTFVLKVAKSGGGTNDYEIRYTNSTAFVIGGHSIPSTALTDGSRVKITAKDADGVITASKVEVEQLAP